MTIALNLGSYSDIGDYSSLVDKIKLWLDRGSDLDPYIPTFISLIEANLNRTLRTPDMEAVSYPALTNGQFALPADFLAIRSVSANGNPLTGMSPAGLAEAFGGPAGYAAGWPLSYAVTGRTVMVAPVSGGTVTLTYWQRISGLSLAAPTNWLLTAHPDIYLFGALAQAQGYIENPDRGAQWTALFDAAVESLVSAGNKARWGGPIKAKPFQRVRSNRWGSGATYAPAAIVAVSPTPMPDPTPTPTPTPTLTIQNTPSNSQTPGV